jgi:hypothetical protein
MNILDNIKSAIRRLLVIDDEMHSHTYNSINSTTIYDNYTLYDAWAISDAAILSNTYKSLPGEFSNSFWRAVPNKYLCKRTTGIASIVLNLLCNIINENFDGIEFDEDKKEIEKIGMK